MSVRIGVSARAAGPVAARTLRVVARLAYDGHGSFFGRSRLAHRPDDRARPADTRPWPDPRPGLGFEGTAHRDLDDLQFAGHQPPRLIVRVPLAPRLTDGGRSTR